MAGMTIEAMLKRADLVAEARSRTGLEDFGDEWFFTNLDKFLECLKGEARLSMNGAHYARETIITSLVNRLRFIDAIKRNPEIDDEEIQVAAVIAGLPRTGSTMLHRMLASAPGMTGAKWYETKNYAPFPGEQRGDSTPRREAGKVLLQEMIDAIPDLLSMHPMDLDAPDEELMILGHHFSSTMLEGTFFIPTFARWQMTQDRRQAYRDLKRVLKLLQWYDPSRRGKKWVLKTPGHLMGIAAVMEVFPEAKLIMTHRDPVQIVPSWASMEHGMYLMVSDQVGKKEVGAFWLDRLAELLNGFVAERERVNGRNFIDVPYSDLLAHPVETGTRVLEAAGVTVTDDIVAGMAEWIEANKREDRAPHKYTLEEYGLEKSEIERKFDAYRRAFLQPSK